MTRIYQRLIYIAPMACIVALFAIFQVTNPISIGPGGILIVFILLYTLFASVFFLILHVGLSVVAKLIMRRRTIEPRQWNMGVRRSYYIASILAFAPVCLIAMQSIGQLQLRDIGLVFLLTSVAIFYVLKRA